jgi:hypothetical protein
VQRWNLPDGWVISARPARPELVSEADFIAAQAINAGRPGELWCGADRTRWQWHCRGARPVTACLTSDYLPCLTLHSIPSATACGVHQLTHAQACGTQSRVTLRVSQGGAMTGQRAANIGDYDHVHWRAARRSLNERRHQLATTAARLYTGVPRVGSTLLLCRPEWLPAGPVELDQLQVRWAEPAPVPTVSGASPTSAHLRPRGPDGHRYPTYADAMAVLDPPATFENRPTYRPLDLSLIDSIGGAHLDLTAGRYFDSVSTAEALAHELAAALPNGPAEIGMDGLPFRGAIGDPCDLTRRPASLAISTLTVRRSPAGDATFLLHWRDPAKVTHAGGLFQVVPVGVFQPVADTPESERADLSLWRAMVREFSEELLGAPEDYISADGPFRYGQWDFYRHLTGARDAGRLGVWCLGMGVDPLTLVADILTVAVFDADVFDAAFSGLVAGNAEGRIITSQGEAGFPFTEQVVARFTNGTEPMQAAGAATLQLAWNHRGLLLG